MPSALKTSSWLEKLAPPGAIESKQLSKVNVFSFFFPSLLAKTVCEGEGIVTTWAVPRDNSRWLKGRTRTATWKRSREVLHLKFTCIKDGQMMQASYDTTATCNNCYALAFAA